MNRLKLTTGTGPTANARTRTRTTQLRRDGVEKDRLPSTHARPTGRRVGVARRWFIVAVVAAVAALSASCARDSPKATGDSPPAASRADSQLGTPDLPPLQFDPVADDPTTVGADINSEALFALGSAELSSQAEAIVEQIKARIDQGPSYVRIDGYTDGLGDDAANKDLSRRRAQALADRITALGTAKSVVACGDGEVGTDGKSADPSKRRVVVSISSKPVNEQCQ